MVSEELHKAGSAS
jgi:hypothetical protein